MSFWKCVSFTYFVNVSTMAHVVAPALIEIKLVLRRVVLNSEVLRMLCWGSSSKRRDQQDRPESSFRCKHDSWRVCAKLGRDPASFPEVLASAAARLEVKGVYESYFLEASQMRAGTMK